MYVSMIVFELSLQEPSGSSWLSIVEKKLMSAQSRWIVTSGAAQLALNC